MTETQKQQQQQKEEDGVKEVLIATKQMLEKGKTKSDLGKETKSKRLDNSNTSTQTAISKSNQKRRSWAGGGETNITVIDDDDDHNSDDDYDCSSDHKGDDGDVSDDDYDDSTKHKDLSSSLSSFPFPKNANANEGAEGQRKRRISAVNAVAAAAFATTAGRQPKRKTLPLSRNEAPIGAAAETASNATSGRKRARATTAHRSQFPLKEGNCENELERHDSKISTTNDCVIDDSDDAHRKLSSIGIATNSIPSISNATNGKDFTDDSIDRKIATLKAWEVVWPENDANYSSDAVAITNIALSKKKRDYRHLQRTLMGGSRHLKASSFAADKVVTDAVSITSNNYNGNDSKHNTYRRGNIERRKRSRGDLNNGSNNNNSNDNTDNNNNESNDVLGIKMELYLEAMKVHRGKGSERLFANYWDALARYVSATRDENGHRRQPRSCTDGPCNGIEDVLNRFLKTKGMRRLHNKLVLGLLKDCIQTTVPVAKFHCHIPRQWKNKVVKNSLQGSNHAIPVPSTSQCRALGPEYLKSAWQPPDSVKSTGNRVIRDELCADECDIEKWKKRLQH